MIIGEMSHFILVGFSLVRLVGDVDANVGEGLARGCSSTEADVWLKNGKLYVSGLLYPSLG